MSADSVIRAAFLLPAGQLKIRSNHISEKCLSDRLVCIRLQTRESIRMDWRRRSLENAGFFGWISFRELTTTKPPPYQGVYVVARHNSLPPEYLDVSVGGHFKGIDPTMDIAVLQNKWVDDAIVVYIGKATNLRARLGQYRRYGLGRPVGHQGGRYIWQLADHADLLVAWRETPDEAPHVVETRMIADFTEKHDGRHPFANLRG